MGRVNTRPSVHTIVDLQTLGAQLRTYGEIDNDSMRDFNPSVCWHDGKLKIAIRRCNFKVDRHGRWFLRDGSVYSRTIVLLGDVDPDTMQVSNVHELTLSKDSPTRTKVAGLEDVRLFSRKDGLYAIGFESDRVTKHLHNKSATMAEYLVKGNELKYIRTLEKPDESIVEKNWSPADTPTSFEFTYSPTQTWAKSEVVGEPYKGILHGGTQLIKQEDGTYISIIHDKVINPLLNRPGVYDKYVYRHYLARHDKNGFVTHMTEPFNFGTLENIEFAAGMVEYEDDFIVSIGIRDCKYALVKVNKNKLVSLLQPFTV